MGILDTTLNQLVVIDKESNYSELIEKIKLEKSFGILIKKLADKVNGINRSEFNEEYLDSLSNEEIVALIRTLTMLEAEIKILSFGSTSPIPSLIERLNQRNFGGYEDLVDWVFRNKTNDYLPFGSNKCWNANSLQEYLDGIEKDGLRKAKSELDNELKRIKRLEEKCPKATHDLRNAIKRKDWKAFESIINRGADIHALDDDGKSLFEKMKEIQKFPPIK